MESYKAQCPYNCEGKLELSDVNPNEAVKRYSDSQYMSFYSNVKGTANGFNAAGNKENSSPGLPAGFDRSGLKFPAKQFVQSANGQFAGLNRAPMNINKEYSANGYQADNGGANRMHMSDAMAYAGAAVQHQRQVLGELNR